MELANYLYSIVYSELYTEKDWKSWGEKLLTNMDYNDDTEWLYNVVFTSDKQKLFEVLADRMICENYLHYNSFVLTEIIQGYYYYQYQCKKINLYMLLEMSGDVADAGQDTMGCEFFYDLLNKIDYNPSIVDSIEFINKMNEYFEPLYRAAMEQKRKLESATIEDLVL